MSGKSGLSISIDPSEMKQGSTKKRSDSSQRGSRQTLTDLSIDASLFSKQPAKSAVSVPTDPVNPVVEKPLEDVTTPIVSNTAGVVPVIQEGTPLGSGKVVSLIGQGGMTRVYKIWNEELEMYRAVKLVNQVFSGDTSDRFRTEAKICAKFDHPNIIHIYNVGKWYDIPYIEMEYIDGETLDYYIKKFGRLPAKVAGAVALTVAQALNHAHNAKFTLYGEEYNGIIHRDLKPSNIMISSDGTVKLMDFGIARPVETGFHTQADLNVVGTIQYFSPEQLDNKDVDQATDIYALGAILYEMLTGTKTFPYTTLTSLVKMKMINSYKDLNTFDFAVERELKAIASKALKTDKKERYRDADSLVAVLSTAYTAISDETPADMAKRYVADPNKVASEEIVPEIEDCDFEQKKSLKPLWIFLILLVVVAGITAAVMTLR